MTEQTDNIENHEEYTEDEWRIVEEHEILKEVFEWEVENGQGQERIDKYVTQKVKDSTRSKIQTAIDEGRVTVNGNPVKSNYKIRPKDVIQYIYYHHPNYSTDIIPEDIPLNIVYEDDDVMVINKPANMVVHPGHGNYTGTLVNALAYYLRKDGKELDYDRMGLVHRIDKDTTGLLLIAKNEHSMLHLQNQFKEHTVHRRYIGLAWGDFEEEEGTVNVRIGRNERNRKIMHAYDDVYDEQKGRRAVTHWKVLERFLYVTLLEFRLETGRTHQIRVHSQYIGHPLFNDTTYGGDRIVKGTIFSKYKQFVDNCFKILPRQALHAKELGFLHPTKNEFMTFTSELPEDMNTVIERWRTYTKNKF